MKNAFLFVFAFFFVSLSISAQTDDGKTSDSKIIEVRKGIYLYQNKGGNIGLSIGHDGVFMIDNQFADISEDILKDIKRLTKKEIKFVVNTHHHGDHTGGNVNMAKEGVTIFAHENVRLRLKDYMEKSAGMKIDQKILPVITFKENLTFHFNGEQINVFHISKAHTDGDVVVYFTNSNVIHTGDAYVKGMYPFIDRSNGGTVEGYMEGLGIILEMIEEDTVIIPGHGDVANLNDIKELGNLMGLVWKRVAYQFLSGKSEAQIVAMRDITSKWDEKGYGDGFISRERFLRTIYKEVAIVYDQSDNMDAKKKIEQIKKDRDGGK